jgi:hypothetical protein
VQKIDDLIQEKLRNWQIRRLEIKDRMQSQPEKTLELSRVLDLMDEEHAAILSGSATDLTRDTNQPNSTTHRPTAAEHSPCPGNDTFELQLHVAASNPDDLRKLLEMAVYELQRQIDAQGVVAAGERSTHPGGMSGTLGAYHFELGCNGGIKHG